MSRIILLVEDAEDAAAALEIALAGLPDAQVLRVADGLRAVEYLAPENGHPVDAVVTDLQLPFLDGFELIRRIRQQPRLRQAPVVVVSGHRDPKAPERALALGADAFFPKPCSPLQVRKTIEDLWRDRPARSL